VSAEGLRETMIPIVKMGVEISVDDVTQRLQAPFTLTEDNKFHPIKEEFGQTVDVGENSEAYIGISTPEPGTRNIVYMLNYHEPSAKMIKAWMMIDYYPELTVIDYDYEGIIEESAVLDVEEAEPVTDVEGIICGLFWSRIGHILFPEGTKHVLRFGETCLEVYNPFCLEQINIYKRRDKTRLEFAWVWRRDNILHGEYELRMSVYETLSE